MAKRTLICVGYNIPGDDYEYIELDSDRSLLDADVILFQPEIPGEFYGGADYQGKPTLSDSGSHEATASASHWKAELTTALNDGKTVIVFLAKPEDVWVYTGQKQFSGTGRNRHVTNIVAPFSSYAYLPAPLRPTPRRGTEIRVAADLGPVAEYWRSFGESSPYQVYLEAAISHPLLTTKTGNKTVGGLHRLGAGTMVLVPPVQYDEDAFTELRDGEEYWSADALSFGARLASSLFGIDSAIRCGNTRTPPPAWAAAQSYRLKAEEALTSRIDSGLAKIAELEAAVNADRAALEAEGSLRALLYASGPELEAAVLDALRIIGFEAEAVREGESEFDAVFVSPEGRFLGEAEGKDNRAINIDKLGQLERNLQEDFARQDVTAFAKGVLFGNAYRLTQPEERGEFFTDKCKLGAKRAGLALVRTPDLFAVAKFAKESADLGFAKACREAIAHSAGDIVVFPTMPGVDAAPRR